MMLSQMVKDKQDFDKVSTGFPVPTNTTGTTLVLVAVQRTCVHANALGPLFPHNYYMYLHLEGFLTILTVLLSKTGPLYLKYSSPGKTEWNDVQTN